MFVSPGVWFGKKVTVWPSCGWHRGHPGGKADAIVPDFAWRRYACGVVVAGRRSGHVARPASGRQQVQLVLGRAGQEGGHLAISPVGLLVAVMGRQRMP